MQWIVRAAVASDVGFLTQATLGNALDSEGIHLDPTVVEQGVTQLLGDGNKGRLFVACDEYGAPAGSCYVTFEWSDWHAAWYWWIQSVFVPAPQRRKGVYSALHSGIMQAAEVAGNVRSVRLYVERHNLPALAAYRRHGMTETPYVVFEQVVHPTSR